MGKLMYMIVKLLSPSSTTPSSSTFKCMQLTPPPPLEDFLQCL